jgi:hypothetical protein
MTRPDLFLLFSRSQINGLRSTSSVSSFRVQPSPDSVLVNNRTCSIFPYLHLSISFYPRSILALKRPSVCANAVPPPRFFLSVAQFSVPGPHQMNLLGQPRFLSAHRRNCFCPQSSPSPMRRLVPACQIPHLQVPINCAASFFPVASLSPRCPCCYCRP